MKARRGKRIYVGIAAAVALLAVASVAFKVLRSSPRAPRPPCQATDGTASYGLDLAQAANATTIAAVGKRLGMPDHAVTIALSAALLESRLHNLPHGDRDSLGLFQQRPSQGWGTPAQLMTPRYAAAAFYRGLARVKGWETLPVTVAAQRVQRSAMPSGYAREEGRARVLAQALTGEIAAGMTCQTVIPSTPPSSSLAAAVAAELGSPNVGEPLAAARGWTVALWLVGHAAPYRVTTVGFAGMRWTASSGQWQSDESVASQVTFAQRG